METVSVGVTGVALHPVPHQLIVDQHQGVSRETQQLRVVLLRL